MSISLETLALSKSYTKKSIIGLGAIKGANCQISNIVDNGDGTHTITFLWKDTSDVSHTSELTVKDGETPVITTQAITGGHKVTFTTTDPAQSETFNVMDGEDGVSITDVDVDASNHLIVTLSTGSTIDAGEITVINELSAMDDVDLGTLADGDSLVYDATSGKWINKELSYEYSVEDLTDVDIDTTTLADGDIIKWDATNFKWVKGQIPTIESLDDIGDVTLTALADGQIIKYNAVLGKWVNEDDEVIADLDDLQDVVIDTTTLENGQILKYDSVRNVWYNGSASAVSTKVEDLEDVSIDSIEDGQVLVWDATNQVWVNGSSGSVINKLSDIEDVQVANLHDGDMIKYDAINKVWYNVGFDNAPTQNSDKMLDSNAVYQSELDIKNKIGDLTQLDTTVKTDLVGAINEVKGNEGDLSTLTTDVKTTLVGAVNELDAHVDSNKTEIGNLSNLTTTEKTSLVGAVNEVDAAVKNLKYAKQVTALGNAEDSPNAIVQYVGATSGELVKGYYYYSEPSVDQGVVVYTWKQLDVQPTDDDYENLQNKPQINSVELIGNKSLDDLGINGKFQYSTLPQATNALVGKIVEYTGGNTASLKNGYFYKCQYVSENDDYEWIQLDVSSNTELANKVATLETNQGDMSQLVVAGVSDLVSAINKLSVRGIKSITYSEPYLTITLMDDSTFQFDITVILNATELGDLGNVIDTTIANTNVLQYDSTILKYKPYDVVGAMSTLLQDAKDYTDTEIGKINLDDAFYCDSKPSVSYDSATSTWIVVYYQASQVHTSTDISARYYYKDANDDPYCTSWFLVESGGTTTAVELTYLLSSVNLDDFVSKSNDVVSTYTTDMADKTKIPNIASMDALYAIVATALGQKVNTSDIVNNLLSDATDVPLSAAQGKVLNLKFNDKQDVVQMSTMPQVTTQMVTDKVIYQYIGDTSQAYTQGYFYLASYDSTQDVYYWKEVKFSADYDSQVLENSTNAPQGGAVYDELQLKQNVTLSTPIVIEGTQITTVESGLGELNTAKAKKFQVTTMPSAVEALESVVYQFIGASTNTYTQGSFYICEEITPSTDPKTYSWRELTAQITVDGSLSTTSANPVQNNTLTNAIQALQDGVIVLYASESVLPQTVNYNTGVIVTVGTVGYCVSERSWHKVTAIDSTTLAITWGSYDPHLASEIVAGDAIEIDSTDNSVNVIADGETAFIASTTYYAWKDSNDNLVFTLSMTPSVGDVVYNESATATSDLVEAYDSTNLTIDVNSVTYARNNADNYVKTALGGLIPNASDFNISGRNVMLDVTQRTFTGTRAEFNALSSAEKSKYLILNITDEVGQGITVVNTIANNNMNVPTSNAVYNYAVAKTLSSPLTLGGTQYTDVDTLLGAIVSVLNGSAYWQ